MIRAAAAVMVVVAATVLAPPVLGADVPNLMETARQAYQKGDIALAAHALEGALVDLQGRLGRGLSGYMPAAPSGWTADESEIQGLGAVGGGLSVTRAYTKADASLNASIILDSPAVEAAGAMFRMPVDQPNLKLIKVGNEDAILRWDPAAMTGEITMVIGNRVLLQIEGDSITGSDHLVNLAKGFNVAGIRKLVGV